MCIPAGLGKTLHLNNMNMDKMKVRFFVDIKNSFRQIFNSVYRQVVNLGIFKLRTIRTLYTTSSKIFYIALLLIEHSSHHFIRFSTGIYLEYLVLLQIY